MQLLIMRHDNGAHLKGDIIEIRASGTPFGGAEPDHFVLVEVPDLPMAAYEQFSAAWDRVVDFAVVGSDPATDTFRLRMYSTLATATQGAITWEEVATFIEGWNGIIQSYGTNEVVFDISIYDALTSRRFWEVDVSGVLFGEESYDHGTGVHRIAADYAALENNPTYIERYVARLGLTIVSHASPVIIYDADRAIVREVFERDLAEAALSQVARHRYFIDPNVVDVVIAQGGTITTTAANVAAYVQDKASG